MRELQGKIDAIRKHFGPWIGREIASYETAELLGQEGTWAAWRDLPIRLFAPGGHTLAVAWSELDDLWMATDSVLPFAIEDANVCWVQNSIQRIHPVLGAAIRSVALGRGHLSIEGREIEIWSRLLIEVAGGWLEIFNALDENGYDFHARRPGGQFIECV